MSDRKSKDQKRMLIMLPVLAIAAWLAFFGDKKPAGQEVVSAAAAPDVVRGQAPQRAASGQLAPAAGDVIALPPPSAASVPASSREGFVLALKEESPTNLFAVTAGAAAVATSPVISEEDVAPPPPSFVVIGSVLKDGRFNVFLDKDGQTYVATPGAVIDGNRVDVVKSDQVQLFNLSTKTTQIIPVQGDK